MPISDLKSEKMDLKPVEMKELDQEIENQKKGAMKEYFLKKIEDLTLNIVKSLEVEIQEMSVRVMTSELH